MFGFATTFCEFPTPCGPSLPQNYYSNIFGVAGVNGVLYLAFSSDLENRTPYGSRGFYYVVEPPGWYDAMMYLDPALRAQGYTAFFTSTPEPGSMILPGTGILGLAGVSKLMR